MERLLVASDLTKRSHHALGRAVRLAKKTGAALRIISAIKRSASAGDWASARLTLLADARKLAEGVPGVELDVSVRIPARDPAEAIIEEARRFSADLILLGAHGEPQWHDAIFGTTATHMIGLGRPVLVVQNDDARPYSKVMVAVGDDTSAEEVIRAAFTVAPAAEVFAVHACDTDLSEPDGGDVLEIVSTDPRAVLELTLARVTRSVARRSVKTHAIVRQGNVTAVLGQCWTEIQPDLLVMGTEGRSGLSRLLHGSFADFYLFQCPSDLLVVPTDGGTSTAAAL